MLQQRNQIARTNHRQLAAEVVLIERRDRPGHMPAVAASSHHDAAAIQIGTLFNPINQRADVLIGSLTQKSVVELKEALAISGRSTDIGKDYGHTEFVHIVVRSPREAGT